MEWEVPPKQWLLMVFLKLPSRHSSREHDANKIKVERQLLEPLSFTSLPAHYPPLTTISRTTCDGSNKMPPIAWGVQTHGSHLVVLFGET